MSYCRWSSLNGYSDVYVYEDVSGGWTTHVAQLRPPPGAPESGLAVFERLFAQNPGGDWKGEWSEEVRAADAARDAWNAEHPPVPIDHPEAGSAFNHATPGECADNLLRLRAEGFVVPDAAIEALREEQGSRPPRPED